MERIIIIGLIALVAFFVLGIYFIQKTDLKLSEVENKIEIEKQLCIKIYDYANGLQQRLETVESKISCIMYEIQGIQKDIQQLKRMEALLRDDGK